MTAYFIRRFYRSERPGMYGWECVDTTVADMEAGKAELAKPAERGTTRRELYSFDGKNAVRLHKVKP